ncbi:hypothetical protein GCM10009092_24470 [Bowmanella denitrificans]|uniref:Copper chaperone PCu(A)C n=1 Tax=Bowmanella denitrificans TaxID=366582 RepID=A0ABN0XAH4_9ALTE
MRSLLLALLLSTSTFVTAQLQVDNATIRLLPPGVLNTAGYFTLVNHGQHDRILVGARCSLVQKAELHDHQMVDGMMKMTQQQRVIVPAGEQVAFQPGGLHLMLFGLKSPLQDGQRVPLTLLFADGEELQVDAVVGNAVKVEDHSHHHH